MIMRKEYLLVDSGVCVCWIGADIKLEYEGHAGDHTKEVMCYQSRETKT